MPSTDSSQQIPASSQTPMDVDPEIDIKGAEVKKAEGNEFYKKKNYREAVRLYSEAIDLNPKNAAFYGNRSAAYMMDSNYKRALEDAQTSVRLDPHFAKGYLREGKCHIALGNSKAALLSLQKAKDLDPSAGAIMQEVQNARILTEYERKADECWNKRDFRQVVFCMDRASHVAVACMPYKMKKAECLALLGRYDEAQSIAMDALQIDVNNADAVYVRALCLYYDDNIDKAVKFFIQALKLSPDLEKARLTLKKAKALAAKKEEGNEAYKNGRFNEALEFYGEALLIDDNNIKTNAKLRYNRALVASKLGKNTQAIADCNVAIELDERYVKAYLKRAQLCTAEEQFEEALRDYKKVFQMEKTREHKRHVDEAEKRLKMSQRKDYYKILGVGKDASESELKKAYKKRALLHHPDRHSHDSEEVQKEEERKFKECGEAFAVLSDPKKKDRYDRGEDIDGPSMGDFDASNIFQMFFGGGGPGGGFHFPGGGGGGPGEFHFQFG
ncbi:dnaJ homolog subfamily C member 7-like [Styela clava]